MRVLGQRTSTVERERLELLKTNAGYTKVYLSVVRPSAHLQLLIRERLSVAAGHPDFPLTIHFFRLFWGNHEAFQGQPGDAIPPVSPGGQSGGLWHSSHGWYNPKERSHPSPHHPRCSDIETSFMLLVSLISFLVITQTLQSLSEVCQQVSLDAGHANTALLSFQAVQHSTCDDGCEHCWACFHRRALCGMMMLKQTQRC